MKYIVIDTCIIVHILRNDEIATNILSTLEALPIDPILIISTVTKGEIESLKKKLKWGVEKCSSLKQIIDKLICVNINGNDEKLVDSYSEIDAYSQLKVKDSKGELLVGSARKMGKNDLWIAATANVLNAELWTNDNDFDHLNDTFLKLVKF